MPNTKLTEALEAERAIHLERLRHELDGLAALVEEAKRNLREGRSLDHSTHNMLSRAHLVITTSSALDQTTKVLRSVEAL